MDFSKAFLSYNDSDGDVMDDYNNGYKGVVFQDVDLNPYGDILIESTTGERGKGFDNPEDEDVDDDVSDFNKWELEKREEEKESLEEYKLNESSAENAIRFNRLLREEGIPVEITSGFRRGARTKQGNKSHHAFEGGTFAFDVVPKKGYGFNDVYDSIFNSERLVKFMEVNGMGIIDESDEEMLALTGGTAPHLHIGFDKLAVEQFKEKYNELFPEGKVNLGREGVKLLDVNKMFDKYYTSKNSKNKKDVYSDEKAVNDIIPFIKS